MKTIEYKDVIQNAVKFEQAGIDFFQNYARNFESDDQLRDLLAGFAKDEILHRWRLTSILQFLSSESPIQIEDEEWDKLSEMNFHDFDDVLAGKDLDRDDVIKRVMLFEKEAVNGYKTLEEIFGVSPELDQIIEIEEKHIERVNYLLEGKAVDMAQ